MSYSLRSYESVTFPTGDWKVHFEIITPITRTITFGIIRQDAVTGWAESVIASQAVDLNYTGSARLLSI